MAMKAIAEKLRSIRSEAMNRKAIARELTLAARELAFVARRGEIPDEIPDFWGRAVKEAIEGHLKSADYYNEQADRLEEAWEDWDIRYLASHGVIARASAKKVEEAMERIERGEGTDDDNDWTAVVGKNANEIIKGLRDSAADEGEQALDIDDAWRAGNWEHLQDVGVV